jgi:acetoin utilization deacetylase AcuC-like enzyme
MMHTQKLGLVFFPAFDWAISPTHPEREERLLYTRDQIVEEGLLDMPSIREYKPKIATYKDIERVHVCVPDIASLITNAHLVSAGGAIVAADAVMNREVNRAFALVRPPGHHAMRVVHGTRGFCTINIEAIMVEYLRKIYGIGKVAIIDTDVHHGDGTQDVFYNDPDTLFVSFHQDGRTLYPGTGFTNEMGSPNALGTTINIPLPPGTTDVGLHEVLDHLIMPILADFKPDIIINSAGQDNHYSDPLANMAIMAQGYARLADKLKADIAICPSQSSSVTHYIKEIIEERQRMWAMKEKLRQEAIAKSGEFWQRTRSIYYDDDGINEQQKETVRLCPQCSGYVTIGTEARGGFGYKTAYIAIIPSKACPTCQRAAYDAVHRAKQQGQYQHYIVQNKYEDRVEIL